jgi:hypothetical protein
VWKGTEVAIKVIASDNATKELEKSFRDEARLHRYPIMHIHHRTEI